MDQLDDYISYDDDDFGYLTPDDVLLADNATDTADDVDITADIDEPDDDTIVADVPDIVADTTVDDDDDAAPYYDVLVQKGVLDLPEDFEFDGTYAGLEKAIEASDANKLNKVVNSLWNSLPEDFRPLLKYGLDGGKNLKTYLETFAPVSYDELDLSSSENQKKVMYDYYKNTSNYDDAKIERMIRRLEDTDDLEAEALDAKEELLQLKTQRAQEFETQAQKEREAEAERMKQQANMLASVIDSESEFEDARKNKLKGFFFNQVQDGKKTTTEFVRVLNSVMENPKHLVQLANVLADYDSNKGLNFERLSKKAKTEGVNSLKQTLQSKLNPKSQVRTSSNKSGNTNQDID